MSKLIAVWGCPGSGKTTFCIKLAKMIYDTRPAKIICVLTDPVTPALPVLFPNKRPSDLHSIGAVLSGTEITQESILKNLVTADESREIGFLGWNGGENKYSYPEFSAEKVSALFDAAASLADYVIVDCGTSLIYPLPLTAIKRAHRIFRMCKPDLKAISFFSSQSVLYTDAKYRMDEHIVVMSVNEQEQYPSAEEIARHFGCERLIIPYARAIRQQAMDGRILQRVSDKGWQTSMQKLIKAVV